MNNNSTNNSRTLLPVDVCSMLKSFNVIGSLLLRLRDFRLIQFCKGFLLTLWPKVIFITTVIFYLSLITTKSGIAQNMVKVIEKPEKSQISNTSKQIVPVVAVESMKGMKKAEIFNDGTLSRKHLMPEQKVIALPKLNVQSGKILNEESIVIIDETEMRHIKIAKNNLYNQTEKQKKEINYSDLIKNGQVTPKARNLSDPGTNIQNVILVEDAENNAKYLKSGSKRSVELIQNSGLMANNPPVAIPDVYTTPENTELVVAAPGHLGNDYDPDGDPVTWLSFVTPENGTLTGAATDGQFTYTPDPGFSGIESIVVTISDGNGNTASGLIMILVVPDQNRNPVAVPDVYTTPENTELIVTAPGHLDNDYDPDGDPVTWLSFVAPDNGTVTGAATDGQFTFTPDPGFSGIENISVTISDGKGNTASGIITILVVPDQNRNPVAVPDAYTTPENTELIIAAPGHLGNDYDPDGDPVTWLSFVTPDNGTVTGAATDGQFTYTPNPGFSGIEKITVTISDGNGNTATGQISVTVSPSTGDAPVAVADVYTLPQNTVLNVAAPGHLENDFDPNGDQISWLSFVTPGNGTVSNASTDGQFTYTPDPGFSGIENISVTISDGNGNFSDGLITILVVPDQNRAPVAVPDVYVTNENTLLNVVAPGHLSNDTDADGDPISWLSFVTPENGTVSGAATDGQFIYTPNPGFSGVDNISVTISDGNGNFASGLITILVVPEQNRAPVAVPDVYVTNENTLLNVAAPGHLSNDTDADGDPISWLSFVTPENGTLSGAATDGQFSYTPDPGFFGIETIPITVIDGNGNSAQGLIAIAVLKNNPPIADAGEDQTVLMTQIVTLDGTGSTDPDNNTLNYSWMFATTDAGDPIPAGSTAVLSNAETATPSFVADLPGVYSVKLIVNDGLADSEPDYVIVTALSIIEALDNLIENVTTLESDGIINRGQANSLVKKIEQAQKLLDKDKIAGSLDVLNGLRQQILDLYQQDGVLSESQAMALIAKIDEIITAIGGQASLAMDFDDSPNEMNLKSSTGLQKDIALADRYALSAIYPNPFQISAEVVFNVPVAANVRIEVYNLLSQKVAVLQNGYIQAGQHKVLLSADGLKSGTYIVRMTAGDEFKENKRIMLVR
ncbi:Ig-like domain-containing protein [Mariniphaga sp.]|uniref:Ig-like domain-containing protein n=1 Tax=Mariniphaga sp. TaxID=1954475 RepID=UPI0035621EB8